MADGPAGPDWLSATLRDLREATGLSGVRAAAAAGLSQSRLSRIESGRFTPTTDEITRLSRIYNAPAATRRQLLATRAALRPGQSSARVVVSRGGWKMQHRIGLAERNATEISEFQPVLILGLLQTADYARLVMGDGGWITGDDLDRAVAERMKRADVLDSGRRFIMVMPEGALRWQAGSPQIMTEQLAHITDVIRSRPNVRVGIIPQSRAVDVFPTHGFEMYDRRLVSFGVRTGTTFINDAADVAEYAKTFAGLEALASFGEDAVAIIGDIARSY